MYVCVLDIDQRDLRTKDENKLRHMKQKQFHLVGVVVVLMVFVCFEFFFTFAHYYIYSHSIQDISWYLKHDQILW